MSDDISPNNEYPDPPNTKLWAAAAFLAGLPFYLIYSHLGEPGKARAAGISVGVIFVAAHLRWKVHTNWWFWMALAILVLLHGAVVQWVQWGNGNYPGIELLPVGIADLFLCYFFIKMIGSIMKKSPKMEQPTEN